MAFRLFVLGIIVLCATRSLAAEKPSLPNVVIIFCDDLGYADVGCFNGKIPTPNIDRVAREGMRFTDFYVAQAVCSASRTAMLTGCLPNRVGILGALGPGSKIGIHDDETTLGEVVKKRGYATGAYGKWHLGHHPQFLPVRHGFDEYYGLPYSNDMWPYHPTAKFPPLPMIENDKIVNANVTAEDQTRLTSEYTQRAVSFIEKNQQRPFLVYLAHSMPHVPLYVSEKFKGKSDQGLFGDVIMEIDWSVGQVLETLRRLQLDERTLVIFTSDNGPWLSYGNHAGSAVPLREGKGTMYDGGCRVPCAMRWPSRIPAGTTCRELAATVDILPTIAGLIDLKLDAARPIDGLDILPLMEGRPGAKTPHEAYPFYWGRELHAIRSGPWKLHFPHAYRSLVTPGKDGKPGPYRQEKTGLALYNLEKDIEEQHDIAAANPEIVERLKTLAEKARDDLGDSLTDRQGKSVREVGKLRE